MREGNKIEQIEAAEGAQAKRKKYLRDTCYIAMFAAVIAVCSWLAIPISEISVTLQTLGVCAAAGLLGMKRGTLSVIVYILLGVCCVPVFSGFKNFYALIGSASAGYVVGFVFTALLVGFTSDRLHIIGDRYGGKIKAHALRLCVLAVSMAAGVAVCYLFGTLWFMLIYKGSATTANLHVALTYCVYPYILPDFVKIIVATVLVDRLKTLVK